MTLIKSNYKPKFPFKNGHFSTIYSAKFRPSPKLIQLRERLQLADGDFMDIDFSFSKNPSKKVTILLHGLEGNAQRTYIRGQTKVLIENGWDVAAVNFRGCSGEKNLSFQSYNAGKTDDLEAVVDFILKKDKYNEIALVGFSLGGNLLLKYLGERESFPKQIKKAVAISTPLSLKGSLESLNEFSNWIYQTSFLINLRKKYKAKMKDFPERMTVSDYKKITSLLQFDHVYTAPAHGFKDAFDYYKKNSSLQFIPNIQIPVYILNAANDSFLSSECYPKELASTMKNLQLEIPKYGGHVGFHQTNKLYYSESRTLEFLNE
ncbi:putative hydrolase of the alpha/beta-hydrolase fold protein [Aequorivita sublithincola DSM 14238]|uniref:Putative hydrolase of the alpha/beta-hydrolase fold protein n=1 Tax=Aequorivita sublithincola (strain DSM 14238 / LMG 21431 / ACAM 643 / 9-3) TaxID=746697 RepID=I3YVM8_AEQSU|nr:alpha/beta fold hydrolase [Aequorivita sublithincola]AFL81046.1 putative hydrolase of the alpha/beta-hydrolase fold protein [Aequorivita sublithincola DSM 14238]